MTESCGYPDSGDRADAFDDAAQVVEAGGVMTLDATNDSADALADGGDEPDVADGAMDAAANFDGGVEAGGGPLAPPDLPA